MQTEAETIIDVKTPKSLSKNEAKVLYALIKYAGMKDQEIHERIGMKKSTFSSIKLRLIKEEMYKTYFVPSFPRTGFELFVALYGQLNRLTTIEERMRLAGDMLKSFDEDFFIVSENNKAFNLAVSSNYTEYDKNYSKFLQLYSLNNFLTDNGMTVVPFPFETSNFHAFMDFQPMIERIFGIPITVSDKLSIPREPISDPGFSNAEVKVFVGLVTYPGKPDTFIAKEMQVSRNTVASAKKRFLQDGLIYAKVIPNLTKLGLNLLAFIHKKFNPASTVEDRKEATTLVKKELTPFFYVTKNLDGIIITAFKDHFEFNNVWGNVLKTFLRKDYIREEPLMYDLSIPQMKVIKHYDFMHIVKKQFSKELRENNS